MSGSSQNLRGKLIKNHVTQNVWALTYYNPLIQVMSKSFALRNFYIIPKEVGKFCILAFENVYLIRLNTLDFQIPSWCVVLSAFNIKNRRLAGWISDYRRCNVITGLRIYFINPLVFFPQHKIRFNFSSRQFG